MYLAVLGVLNTTRGIGIQNEMLTAFMIKSFIKQAKYVPNIVIVDNGTIAPVDNNLAKCVTFVDNFNHKLLPDEHQSSRNHCSAFV